MSLHLVRNWCLCILDPRCREFRDTMTYQDHVTTNWQIEDVNLSILIPGPELSFPAVISRYVEPFRHFSHNVREYFK